MTKISIHRALSELKLIDTKIEKQINDMVPQGVYQKGKPVNGVVPEDKFNDAATSKFNSIQDLIARKTEIKKAIVKSNGETRVTVAGKEMSVADAITFKGVVTYKRQLINRLRGFSNSVQADLNRKNEAVDANLQRILESTYGKDNVKSSGDEVKAISVPYKETNGWHLCDPLQAQDKIEALEKEVSEFEADVDSCLSEINATTFIEV